MRESEAREHLSYVVKAFSHPERLKIMELLVRGDASFSLIHEHVAVGTTALANHLSLLIDKGLVNKRGRGLYGMTSDGRVMHEAIVRGYDSTVMSRRQRQKRIAARYVRGRTEERPNRIRKLKYRSGWVSHLSAVAGCLKFLGVRVSPGWLYGGTGHAFIINIVKGVCPSGPTAWQTSMLFKLATNLGYEIKGVRGHKSESGFEKKQREAWDHVRKSIDADIPCYGWELDIPEYYVIQGYDEVGYWYSGPGSVEGKGPKPWREVGVSDIGVLELYSVERVTPSDPLSVIRDSFAMVLHHATNPPDVIYSNNKTGIPGFDLWIEETEAGTALSVGMAYNAQVWKECRRFGVRFLKEIRKRVPKDLRDLVQETRGHYEVVSDALSDLAKLYPFPPHSARETIGVTRESKEAARLLKQARNAEVKGLDTIRQIHRELLTSFR